MTRGKQGSIPVSPPLEANSLPPTQRGGLQWLVRWRRRSQRRSSFLFVFPVTLLSVFCSPVKISISRFDGSSPSNTMMTLFSVAPVCHGHGGGCGVRFYTSTSGDSAGMGRDRDCREHQPTPFFFPGPPRSVRRLSSNVSVACLVRARHPVLSWVRGSSSLGAISVWRILSFTQSLNLLRGLPCFCFPEASFGNLLSSKRMTCPTQRSRLFRIMASMLADLAMSRTFRLETRSCHLMFRVVRRLCIWKRSSCFRCLVQNPCLTTIEEAGENDRPVHLELRWLTDIVLAQNACLQAAKSLAGLADPGIDLLVETPVTADHAAEVFEVVDRLQLGAINWGGGSVGNCSRCWLKQDLCLPEADGETKEAGGFCKLVDDDLEVRLPISHEDTVVSRHSLCLGCQSAKVEQGAVKPIS